MYHPTRGGVRGGKDQFTWESVKTDKDRECYLGHSLKAPVGRWQEGKDLTWYAKEGNGTDSKTISEFQKAKELEEQALMAALGYRVVKKQPSTSDHQAQQASSSSNGGGGDQISKTNRPSVKGPSLIQFDDKKSIDELLLKLLVKHNINELVQALGGDKDSLKKSKKKKTKKHKSKSSKHDSESSSSSSSSESSSESDNDHRKHPTKSKSKKRKSSPSSTIDSSKKSSHDASKSAKKHKHSSKRSKSSSDDSESD